MASITQQSRPMAIPMNEKASLTFQVSDNGEAIIEDDDVADEEEWVYPYPTDFEIHEKYVDDVKPLKVAIIGAGMSGITAMCLLPAKVPGIQLTIFEKNADVGGTWFENTYPGVRCDIPAHVYQSTFSPNTQWTEEYAQGPEILAYWKAVAKEYDLYSKARFNTKVTGAHWDERRAQWRVETNDVGDNNKPGVDHFDFVITAIGRFNEWKLPDFPGMKEYKGLLRHSSNWDPAFDPKGKRIATIGNGASGIQVTTELQKLADHVDHYARNPTWIAGSFNQSLPDRKDVPMYFTPEQLESFKDPQEYLKYRKDLEGTFFRGFEGQLIDSESIKGVTKNFTESMRRRLTDAGKPELLEKLVPDFPPHCRRLTPGPGYLEALAAPNLTFIQTPIERIYSDGIITTDGVHHPADAIICSTGANVVYAPPFPITSGKFDLARDWKPDGKFEWPYSYLGISTPGFPNLAYLWGPHPSAPSGTNPHTIENNVTYIAKMLRKISSQQIVTMAPSKAATDDFVKYCDAYFPRMNLSLKCSSWSNGGQPGARIHGHWPGSASHLNYIRGDPRWEDWEYTYADSKCRFAYFGNGQTAKELDPKEDMTAYLRVEGQNDLRDMHERWYEI